MATINLTTQLFEGLTDQEANELQAWAEGVVLRGEFPPKHPALIEKWFVAFNHNSDRRLLVISTALPQRVLLSLLKKRDKEFAELCELVNMPVESGHKGVMGAVRSLVDALDLATGVPT
jgi:hypothetical protein